MRVWFHKMYLIRIYAKPITMFAHTSSKGCRVLLGYGASGTRVVIVLHARVLRTGTRRDTYPWGPVHQ
jgi:hypothetical protein